MEQITIKEIAKLCGVGVSTVSRAINNHPDINPATKQMIMETIKKYNYVPNNSARNLKRSDSNTIAVLIKGISNPFFADMIQIFEREINRKKYTFVLQHVEEFEDEVDVAIQLEGNCISRRTFQSHRREAGTAYRTFCDQYGRYL